jgi:hypothetical protein
MGRIGLVKKYRHRMGPKSKKDAHIINHLGIDLGPFHVSFLDGLLQLGLLCSLVFFTTLGLTFQGLGRELQIEQFLLELLLAGEKKIAKYRVALHGLAGWYVPFKPRCARKEVSLVGRIRVGSR